ncbi:Gallate transporter [Paraburkholderia tropica]|uniref:aromatic acid/H+ symport family MFS transporter n=1 Tax=Paraburkholderia tropica TaxID=92647 RepID=UPI001CAB9102|nr:aromatic acid/H+ symport family MFS transporter [Paraburkholderia tropica]CAG9234914.1 Gallate transporter [Paraburkholderia tropica]
MNSADAVDIKGFIDGRRMSGWQWLVLALCFLIVTLDGLDTAVMGFVAPVVMKEWGISRAAFGPVMSAAMVGLAIGALVAGPFADRIGRKKVLIGSVGCFGLFSLLCAFAQTPTELVALRFLTGLGLGAAMPNSTTLLSEYVPSKSRSLLLTIMFTGFNFGSGGGGFIAAALMPHFGWRGVFVFGGVLPILFVPVLMLLLPESARFLLVRRFSAERIAATLSRVCGHRFAQGTRFTSPEPAVIAKAPVRMLFSDGYAMSTLMLWVTYFMGLLIIYLLTGWLPTLIKDAGLPVERAAAITGMFQLGGTVGAIVVGFAMDRMDRNVVIGAAYLLGGVFIFALGMGSLQSSMLTLLVTCAGFFMSGAQTGLNALAPSCYPTRARATGVSWMLGFGRLGGILGSFVGGVLLSLGFSFAAVFSVLAVPALIAAVAILLNRLALRFISAPVADA